MKSGGRLQRKTPLQAGKGFKARGYIRGGETKPQRAEIKPSAPKKAQPTKKKPQKKKKQTLAWETAHMWAVKNQPCRVCGIGGINDAHHCYHDRATKFGGRKAPHRWTIPLCPFCHQDGPQAIHRIKRTWRQMHGADYEHVPAVMLAIYGIENPTDAQIENHWKERGVIP